MLLDVVCSVAFYCQRCGQIHIQDIPYFSGQETLALSCENCSHVQATIRLRRRTGLTLRVPCGICGMENEMTFTLGQLRSLRFEKIYCREDRFELGYIGNWRTIADFNAAEFDSLHPSDDANCMGQQQILLEAVNRVHELAEHGAFQCSCGGQDFTAHVADSSILLECLRCGSHALIPARGGEDLRRLAPGIEVPFMRPDLLRNE